MIWVPVDSNSWNEPEGILVVVSCKFNQSINTESIPDCKDGMMELGSIRDNSSSAFYYYFDWGGWLSDVSWMRLTDCCFWLLLLTVALTSNNKSPLWTDGVWIKCNKRHVLSNQPAYFAPFSNARWTITRQLKTGKMAQERIPWDDGDDDDDDRSSNGSGLFAFWWRGVAAPDSCFDSN